MDTKEFIEAIKKRYPNLGGFIMNTKGENNEDRGEINFHNSRYALLFSADQKGFTVGINIFLSHFDSSDADLNLKNAMAYFDDILLNRIVVLGNSDREENYNLAIMRMDELNNYNFNNRINYEIVSFSTEYVPKDNWVPKLKG